MRSRVIHQDQPHQPRGNAEDLRAAVPLRQFLLADQAQPCLVYKGGVLQSLVSLAAPKIRTGQCLEFPINAGREQ